MARNFRQPALARWESASVTRAKGAAASTYGVTSRATSGPGHGVVSMSTAASAHIASANRTVRAAPSTVAIEPMPPALSGTTSWTAPNACAATPQAKNAASTVTCVVVKAAPASAKPYTAGLTKCVEEVTESRNGRSLNRSPGTEYAATANRLTASTAHDSGPPSQTSTATNGTHESTAATSVVRCTPGSSSAPSAPPLRGLAASEA